MDLWLWIVILFAAWALPAIITGFLVGQRKDPGWEGLFIGSIIGILTFVAGMAMLFFLLFPLALRMSEAGDVYLLGISAYVFVIAVSCVATAILTRRVIRA